MMAKKPAVTVEADHPLLVSKPGMELPHGWKTTGKIVLYRPKFRGKMHFIGNVERTNLKEPGPLVHKDYIVPIDSGSHPEPWIKHRVENPATGERAEVIYHPEKGGGRYRMFIDDLRTGFTPDSLVGDDSVNIKKAREVMEAHGKLMGGRIDMRPIFPDYEHPAVQEHVAWGKGSLRKVKEPKGMAFVPVKNKGELPPPASRKLLRG